MRILIIDDYEVVYHGIKSRFELKCPNSNIYWSQGLQSADKIIRQKKIDLVVSELDFKDLDGLEIIQSMCRKSRVHLLIHTSNRNAFRLKFIHETEYIRGVVYKEDGSDALLNAICTKEKTMDAQEASQFQLNLSLREEEVLNYLLSGYNNKSIAQRLQLSPKTVGTYKHRLLKKLGLQSDYELYSFQTKSTTLLHSIPA